MVTFSLLAASYLDFENIVPSLDFELGILEEIFQS